MSRVGGLPCLHSIFSISSPYMGFLWSCQQWAYPEKLTILPIQKPKWCPKGQNCCGFCVGTPTWGQCGFAHIHSPIVYPHLPTLGPYGHLCWQIIEIREHHTGKCHCFGESEKNETIEHVLLQCQKYEAERISLIFHFLI